MHQYHQSIANHQCSVRGGTFHISCPHYHKLAPRKLLQMCLVSSCSVIIEKKTVTVIQYLFTRLSEARQPELPHFLPEQGPLYLECMNVDTPFVWFNNSEGASGRVNLLLWLRNNRYECASFFCAFPNTQVFTMGVVR